jgi:hypothetical protein
VRANFSETFKCEHSISSGRRRFLSRAGGAVVGTAVASTVGQPTLTQAESLNPRSRIEEAYEMRVKAALYQKSLPVFEQSSNGDEELYPNRVANYSKGLPHNDTGGVVPGAYNALLSALTLAGSSKMETIPLAGVVKLTNPQAGLGFGLEGADSHYFGLAVPPRFASAEQAGEMTELYWQALTRDVPFARYDTDPLINAAATDLSRLSDFRGPIAGGRITPSVIFRGHTPGDLKGPYVSQFLWQEVPYGATPIEQRIRSAIPGLDYLANFSNWLEVQNGASPGAIRLEPKTRYIRNARDLARYVRQDFTYQAFLNACLILLGANATFNSGNPYKRSRTQSGFSTFGAPHILDLLAKVANYGLKAAWYQKWYVHRRLRPEEFGRAVHNRIRGVSDYEIHRDHLNSSALDIVFSRSGTYLLPQAYPEGSPTHPSYPAGHAVIAGACATVLKAFFSEPFVIQKPVEARADGGSLVAYTGAELTVGGELNKLAANISFGRNAAGVHWRSDAAEGLKLGEAVAISIMTDEKGCFSERFAGFSLTKFDGTTIVV